jgi:hypothetical protein
MPTPTIPDGELFFNATTYTGTGSTRSVTNGNPGQSFQPDLVWLKIRSSADSNGLFDSVRGAGQRLQSNDTGAEATTTAVQSAFTSNGFTVGTDVQSNGNGSTYVAWQWKAGGAAVTNTAGTRTSQVSANPTAGFSIVTYTGNGTAGATIGHGLGVAPTFIIVKNRSSAQNWLIYSSVEGPNRYGYLNLTNAWVTDTTGFNNVTPTSTVFTVGTALETNGNGNNLVAYCFTPIAGYSAFGSYTGNGSSDGPFVYLGFRPRFLMIKNASSAGFNWTTWDSTRNTSNIVNNYLSSNTSAQELQNSSFDFLSNGFKVRDPNTFDNGSGNTIIYMAFAENPFKYANAR